MRIGHNQRVDLQLGQLDPNAREFLGRGFAGEFQFMHHHGSERRGRPVAPYRIDGIGLDRHQRGAGRRRRLAEPLGAVGRVQPRVIAETRARREVRLEPFVGRVFDQMLDREQRGVDLVAHLQLVTAVDEDRRAINEHDGSSGRAGEAGEPGEPFLGGRDVFVLMPVGARHDEAVEPAPPQFGAQGRQAPGACGALGRIIERLKARLEHPGNLLSAFRRGNHDQGTAPDFGRLAPLCAMQYKISGARGYHSRM